MKKTRSGRDCVNATSGMVPGCRSHASRDWHGVVIFQLVEGEGGAVMVR